MKRSRKVIVVGGGIMGASAAWHLTKAGAVVTLIEHGPASAPTATASSFGWVGASASTPSDNPEAFADRLKALEEFVRIEPELGPLPIAARGALLWQATEEKTGTMIAEHRAAGTRIECLSRAQIAKKEPRLTAPKLAAWAPDDFALEPAAFAHQLVAAAKAAGACVLQGSVDAIETVGDQITGVLMAGQKLPADVVVLANGYGARAVASTVGVDLPIHESPAVLIRFGAEAGIIRHLLCAQEIELRPMLGGGLASAADYPENGEAGLPALAALTSDAIAQLLGFAMAPSILSINAAQRPMTTSGAPLCGYAGQIDGLYTLVAHPGVILAPLLGRRCAEAVLSLDGRN